MLDRTRTRIAWTALFLALFLMPGLASAQIPKKPDQKCINKINKGASKVSKAQAGDNNACAKDYGKDKIDSAADCVTSDPKGKVAKAISKIKTGDCGGNAPPDLPGLDIDSASIGATMTGKDLDLLEDLFGSDLDGALVVSDKEVEGSKEASKCQAAVLKAAGKCQDAKLSSFNSCKKDGMKAGTVTGAVSLQTECMTPTIPDLKGKIAKKCLPGDFDLAKKCSGLDLDALFPGLDPPVDAAAIDAVIECRVCLALNALDGLQQPCDLFDNGVDDGSCENAALSCQHELAKLCDGGTNEGGTCNTDLNCPPGFPTTRCLPTSFARLETPTFAPGIIFELIGGSSFELGEFDPNGTASFACGLTESIGLVIPSIGVACLTDVGGCDPGVIDCEGGTALDLETVHHHSIDELLLDPNHPLNAAWVAADPNFVGTDCRGVDLACFDTEGDPNCTAHETCAAMCEVYCASLAGNYTLFESGCEGFCRGGLNDRELCTLDVNCQLGGVANSGECIGGNPVAHAGGCTCDCQEVGSGGPSPAGAFWCQVGIQTVLETIDDNNCDGNEIIQIIGQQCVPRTTETITNTVFYGNDDEGLGVNQSDSGTRISCNDLLAGNLSGMAQAGNQTSYDGDLGDSATRTVQECK